MKPTEEEIKQMIEMLNKYNNAQTAEEGFGALGGIISISTKINEKSEETKTTG